MKLRCHRPSLSTAFQVVSGVVPTRTPKDVLKNVKLEIRDGHVTLIGTDQEVGIRYVVPGVETDSAGELLLPTTRVISILRELTDDAVELESTGESIMIRSGHSEFQLGSEDPLEFPPVPEFRDEQFLAVPARALRQMIRRTIFATDVESTRYALGGVLLDLEDETLTLAATDSRRLAVVHSQCSRQGSEESFATDQPVIPTKALGLLERSISDEDEDVQIAVHANEVLIKSLNSTIYARLVEGRFPRYRDVIPAEFGNTIDLVVGPFYSAIRQSLIVTSEESRAVDCHLGEGQLTLKSMSADVGQSTIEMPISYDGESLTVTLDPRYVADFLRVLDPESQITLNLNDAESAVVFRTTDEYTYIVMPLTQDR